MVAVPERIKRFEQRPWIAHMIRAVERYISRLGSQFAAAGSVVYRKAKERGIGHELPTDWFTEDVHP